MDSIREAGIDGIRVNIELEGEDALGMRLRRLRLEGPATAAGVRSALEKQARTILETIDYLDGELGLIEVDGVSSTVQIRSKKPEAGRFVEIVLRGGNLISLETHGAALHISKETYQRLVETLASLLKL